MQALLVCSSTIVTQVILSVDGDIELLLGSSNKCSVLDVFLLYTIALTRDFTGVGIQKLPSVRAKYGDFMILTL